jgi:TrmH family RNA methyltransferase
MISIDKLQTLAAKQRWRKIAKELLQYETEQRFPQERLSELFRLLYNESLNGAIAQAAELLPSDACRAVNTLRHILNAKVGIVQADWDFVDLEGKLDKSKRRCFYGMRIFLEDIRSPFNVGSMFRSAEVFGVEKILLSPLCASPEHPRALRSAKGCIEAMDWQVSSLEDACNAAEAEGLPLFALETGGKAIGGFHFPPKGLLLIGSEELGLSPPALDRAAASLGRLSIPTYGLKASLNASVAFGIAAQAWAAALVADTCRPHG